MKKPLIFLFLDCFAYHANCPLDPSFMSVVLQQAIQRHNYDL